jgi:hypothetical protein
VNWMSCRYLFPWFSLYAGRSRHFPCFVHPSFYFWFFFFYSFVDRRLLLVLCVCLPVILMTLLPNSRNISLDVTPPHCDGRLLGIGPAKFSLRRCLCAPRSGCLDCPFHSSRDFTLLPRWRGPLLEPAMGRHCSVARKPGSEQSSRASVRGPARPNCWAIGLEDDRPNRYLGHGHPVCFTGPAAWP